MNKFMCGLDRILSIVEKWIGSIFLLVMACVCLIQVILRFTSLPLYWTEELARYLFAWTIYLGCSAALMHDSHFSVDILPTVLKGKAKVAVRVLVQLICLAGSIALMVLCFQQISYMILKSAYSPAARINMLFPYSAPAVGMALMTLRGIYKIYTIITAYKNEQHGGGEK